MRMPLNPLRRALFRGLFLTVILIIAGIFTDTVSLAQGTLLEVGSTQVLQGADAVVPVTVRNVTAVQGLGAYQLQLFFNPSGIKINSLSAGAPPFAEPAAYGIDNAAGLVLMNDFHIVIPGPKGDVLIANINLTALSAGSWSINVLIDALVDVAGDDIAATVVPGVIQVTSTGATPTASPTPTATAVPTPLPTPTATPSATPTPIPSPSPTPTATRAPTATPTPAVTSTPLPTPTTVPSYVPTATSTPTPAPVVTATPSPETKPSPTASLTATVATPTPSPAPAPEKEGISTGLLIAIAGIVIVIGGAAIYWFLLRKR